MRRRTHVLDSLAPPAAKPRCQSQSGWVWLNAASRSGMSSRGRGTLPSYSLIFARVTLRFSIASTNTTCAAVYRSFDTGLDHTTMLSRCAAIHHDQARAGVGTTCPETGCRTVRRECWITVRQRHFLPHSNQHEHNLSASYNRHLERLRGPAVNGRKRRSRLQHAPKRRCRLTCGLKLTNRQNLGRAAYQ